MSGMGFWRTGPRSKTYPSIGRIDYHPRRQRHIRLSIRDGAVRVSYPRQSGFAKAEAFALSRRSWILKHLGPAIGLENGMAVGRRHRLRFSRQNHRVEDGVVYAPADDQSQSWRLIKLALQKEAEAELPPLVANRAERSGLQPAAVRIRYMRSQWGSCSAKGNLSLNSTLVCLPAELVDYVIIHELCHLRHLDHSPRFWSLVGEHCPDWRSLKKDLKGRRIGLAAI